jgi:hypothetical protein
MPSNELFSFEIIAKGLQLPEYAPEDGDSIVYPSRKSIASNLDRISYIAAPSGFEYSIRVTYLGEEILTADQAYHVTLYIDGNRISSRRFYKPKHVAKEFTGKRIAGGSEQS